MERDVIIACDFSGRRDVERFLKAFGDRRPWLKIGMELFYAEGPRLVRDLKERGYRIFLDLKLHDIPNTVRRAMEVLAGLGVDMCNIHCGGTDAMMRAALDGLETGASKAGIRRPLLIGVTQLTSTSQKEMEDEILIRRPLDEVVETYGQRARLAGLDGVVCSPLEAPGIHEKLGKSFLTVTPGVRLAGESPEDQHRITTPKEAGALGSDLIVVGRSITRATDPVAAYDLCRQDLLGGGHAPEAGKK